MTNASRENKMIGESIAKAIRERLPFIDSSLIGYLSKGGTYMLASRGRWNDNGKRRDLAAILPGDLGQGQVISLYIGTNPQLVDELQGILDDKARDDAKERHPAGKHPKP